MVLAKQKYQKEYKKVTLLQVEDNSCLLYFVTIKNNLLRFFTSFFSYCMSSSFSVWSVC